MTTRLAEATRGTSCQPDPLPPRNYGGATAVRYRLRMGGSIVAWPFRPQARRVQILPSADKPSAPRWGLCRRAADETLVIQLSGAGKSLTQSIVDAGRRPSGMARSFMGYALHEKRLRQPYRGAVRRGT